MYWYADIYVSIEPGWSVGGLRFSIPYVEVQRAYKLYIYDCEITVICLNNFVYTNSIYL